MVEVTKERFYNWVVDVYLETGQGLSGKIILSKVSREPLDELVAEGKLKIIKEHYSYFPDEEWICLTDVYCVEEFSVKGNHRPLGFIRKYLGQSRDSVIDKKVDEFFEKNPVKKAEYDKEYDDWLEENKDILEKSFQIQRVIEPENSKKILNKDLKEYIKGFNWYQNNDSISDALTNLSKRIVLTEELVVLLRRMIQIKNDDETKGDLKKAESELKMDTKLKDMLCSAKEKNVKEFFDNYE